MKQIDISGLDHRDEQYVRPGAFLKHSHAASMYALRSPLIPKRSQFPEVAIFRTTGWTWYRKV